MDEPTQVAVLSSIPVEYRLVPGTRGTVVVFHGGIESPLSRCRLPVPFRP